MENKFQFEGTISATWCVPVVTFVKRTRPVPSFTFCSPVSNVKVNCGTGMSGFPMVSYVSLMISMHPNVVEELEDDEEEFHSSLSCLVVQPGSWGKSISPSPSLSIPSWH